MRKGIIMKALKQNDQYTLNLEYTRSSLGGWWLELVDRESGKVKILTSKRKDMFDSMTIAHALRWTCNQEWRPMYKAGAM
jgi:hypothetical protein